MEQQKPTNDLTNETIRKKFVSQFDLVNYAIRLAENMIRSGRDARVKIDTQSRAMQVLAEITTGKDQFDELIPSVSVEVEDITIKKIDPKHLREFTSPKKSETRRIQRALAE